MLPFGFVLCKHYLSCMFTNTTNKMRKRFDVILLEEALDFIYKKTNKVDKKEIKKAEGIMKRYFDEE